ncbi:hypothetical protein ALC60_08955 [Trachymyrmex zeteki]|uniref:Tesmin/TSO1-like CXC domain-containing protein n=1 Tax=Mycetomoellerius zeteki TaxID=64791 RepID=A0A151WVY9_9HYME|nr:hypothetical protein ALC60_08955 [Trachymyrmex zeteki]
MNQIEGDYRPHIKTVKARLLQKYGDDIIIAETANKCPVVCFHNTGYKILTEAWYEQKASDPKEERKRIVKAAATIILEDIRSQVYETTHYPPSDNFLMDVQTVVPETLQILLEGIILKNKRGSLEKWKKKCIAFAHCIISAVRPISFSCRCTKGCRRACGCKKAGSKCSSMCVNCNNSCENAQIVTFDSDDEDFDEIMPRENENENEE